MVTTPNCVLRMFPLKPRRRRTTSIGTNRLALEALESRLNPSSSVANDQVTNLYHFVLGRDPEPTGLSAWSAAVESGPASLMRVVDGIFHSEESLRFMVTQDFTRYLARLPEPGGLEHFVSVMDGGRNANLVTAAVLGSREYAEKSAPNDALFVDRLYTQLLDRPGDDAGLASHLAALSRGVTRTHLALSFLNSTEYVTIQVKEAYQGLLGRSGSPKEVDGWVGVAQKSKDGLIGVRVGIAGSLEGANWLKAPFANAMGPNAPDLIFNIVNDTGLNLVFNGGKAPNGQGLQPFEGFVLKPGYHYGYSNFMTYSIDVRTVPDDPTTSIGIASVETRIGSNGNPYLYDTNGLLSFVYNPDYSSSLTHTPYSISGQMVVLNVAGGGGGVEAQQVKPWGWINTSSYDLKLTAVTGTGTNPPVGTIIPSGGRLANIIGDSFEIDILVPNSTEVVGHSVVITGDQGEPGEYLIDKRNLAVFRYNDEASKASGGKITWQDVLLNLAPAVISNNGWSSGMGNTESVAKPGKSFWALDYGTEPFRWTIQDGAAYQSNQPIDYPGGKNYGSRAYPVTLDNNFKASYGPGAGMDGLWQMDIRIGSTGSSDNSFCEVFYLAERVDPTVGTDHYSDGSPGGGGAHWSREIDIMETRWNTGGKIGPQINFPTGEGGGGPFTGWTTDKKVYNQVLGEWKDIGGAPSSQFATFGILIRGNSIWIYAYKPDGTFWYSTDEVVKNSTWDQTGKFVPYIGTWHAPGLGEKTINDRFETGFKNFVYLPANDAKIAGLNPRDNPAAFGQALVHA